jgi:hypothetical protein
MCFQQWKSHWHKYIQEEGAYFEGQQPVTKLLLD